MSCSTRKLTFISRREALTHVKRTRSGGSSQAYRCPECGYWHIGRPVPKHIKRAKRRWQQAVMEDERRNSDAA